MTRLQDRGRVHVVLEERLTQRTMKLILLERLEECYAKDLVDAAARLPWYRWRTRRILRRRLEELQLVTLAFSIGVYFTHERRSPHAD